MKRQQTTKLKLPMFKTSHDIDALTRFFTLLRQMQPHKYLYQKKITNLIIHKN